jgi:hypothetical protein
MEQNEHHTTRICEPFDWHPCTALACCSNALSFDERGRGCEVISSHDDSRGCLPAVDSLDILTQIPFNLTDFDKFESSL